MNVLYCGDENMCRGIFLSVLSLSEYSAEPLKIYILTADYKAQHAIPSSFKDTLSKALGKAGGEIFVLDITERFSAELPVANMSTRFTPLCMLRLFADTVDEIPNKILYLDADVLACADFSEFYNTDISSVELVGVPDRYGKHFFGNIFKADYLNSGVLLLNMKSIRQSGLFTKCRNMCRKKKMFMPDQTALNKLAVKRKADVKYNEQGKIKADTVFKHFTTFFRFFPFFKIITVKPWNIDKVHSELNILEFDGIFEKYSLYFN